MRFQEFKLTEATMSNTSDAKYLDVVNDLLSKGQDLQVGANGEQTFKPDPGQKFANRTDSIMGQVDGEPTTLKYIHVFKSQSIKASLTGKTASETIANKGEIVEGIYGAATMARLIKRPNEAITVNDVLAIISQLPDTPQGGSLTKEANEVESDIADKFELVVKLKPATYADFKNIEKIKSKMGKTMQSVIAFVNNETIPRYAKLFSENGRPDSVDVISDGISDETGTKTDVRLVYKDEKGETHRDLVKYGQSVKVGAVKQFGQAGGGRASQSLEDRFEILATLWNRFGVDVSDLKERFTQANRIEDGYEIVYDEAAKRLKEELAGVDVDNEKKFLKTMVQGIKYFATLNDDNVNLIQFTDKGYYVLDFKRLDRLFNQGMDLDVIVQKGKAKSDPTIALPKVTIIDAKTKQPFLSIRMYRAGTGYIRNYIEKEKALVKLTKTRGSV